MKMRKMRQRYLKQTSCQVLRMFLWWPLRKELKQVTLRILNQKMMVMRWPQRRELKQVNLRMPIQKMRIIPMATSIAAGSGNLHLTKRISRGLGCRQNSLVSGKNVFTKFDLLTPVVTRGLPITQVICRIALQDILMSAVGQDIISNKSKVVDFVDDTSKVKVILEDGRQYEGDVLVGADGIWSKVRSKLFGAQPAKYSNYTCYSGLTNFLPPYIENVGYRVFLGLNQYFVASDVWGGKMQWYSFHKEVPMNDDPPGGKKVRLLELFGS